MKIGGGDVVGGGGPATWESGGKVGREKRKGCEEGRPKGEEERGELRLLLHLVSLGRGT